MSGDSRLWSGRANQRSAPASYHQDPRYAPAAAAAFNSTYGQRIGAVPSIPRVITPPAGGAAVEHSDGLTGVNVKPYREYVHHVPSWGGARRASCSWKALNCVTATKFAIHGGHTCDQAAYEKQSTPARSSPGPPVISFLAAAPRPTKDQVYASMAALSCRGDDNLGPDLRARVSFFRSLQGLPSAEQRPQAMTFPVASRSKTASPASLASHNLAQLPGRLPSLSPKVTARNMGFPFRQMGVSHALDTSTLRNASLRKPTFRFPLCKISDLPLEGEWPKQYETRTSTAMG